MKNFNYKFVLKAILSFFIYFITNHTMGEIPLSLSFLTGFLSVGFNPILQTILFFSAYLFEMDILKCLLLLPSSIALSVAFYVHHAKKSKPGFLVVIYMAVALLPYILGNFNGKIINKLGYSFIILTFAFIFEAAANCIFIKKFKRKNNVYQVFSIILTIIILSIFMIKIVGIMAWQSIALTLMLFMCHFYKNSKALFSAIILSFALSIYQRDLSYIALFSIYSLWALIFINLSTLLSALSLILLQFAICYISGNIPSFKVSDYIFTFLPSIIFLFTPPKFVKLCQKTFTRFEEPKMIKQVINMERGELSQRLNNLALSFSDLNVATENFNGLYLTKDQIIDKITENLLISVCENCPNNSDCIRKNNPCEEDIKKLVSVGLSKGKVTLIDLSRDFSNYCYSTNNMICELNSCISLYSEELDKIQKTEKFASVISMEASSVSKVLKTLAFDFSKQLDFDEKLQNNIFNDLCLNGYVPKNIMIVGDEIHCLLPEENINFSKVAEIISLTTKKKMILSTKTNVGQGILCVFKIAPKFDGSFGIAQVTKDNSTSSGDTHSLIRINEGQFMIALCDGMGSGEKAFNNSKATISLIESFLKSGLCEENAIEITNKLLSICSSDSFSTLDLASFNLYEGKLSTIKIGATYGFLMGENGIKVLENTSLPLGIVDEVVPSFSSSLLCDSDMLIICSDGITDAFFSSTDAIDFLCTQTTRNPQQLADNILQHALSENDGEARDDMTVIVIKIFKKL